MACHGGDSKAFASLKNAIEIVVNFLSALTFSEIQAAVTVRALVYCSPTHNRRLTQGSAMGSAIIIWSLAQLRYYVLNYQKRIQRKETKASDELFKGPGTGQVLSKEHWQS